MATDKALCSRDEVSKEIGNDTLETSVLDDAILAASSYVEQHLGRSFDYRDASSTPWTLHEADRVVVGKYLYLPLPIITLTRVEVGGQELVEGESYIRTSESDLLVWLGDGEWPTPTATADALKLTGTFGYPVVNGVVSGVSRRYRRATVLIAANMTSQNSRDVIGLDGSRTSVIDKTVPKAALDLLGAPKAMV